MPVTINGDYIPPENEGNNRYNSNARNLLAEIKKTTNEAVASYNTKPKAKPYIQRLIFLRSNLPDYPSVRSIFDELVCHAEAASGHGRDKQHWLSFVTQDLILLEWEFKRFNLLPDTEEK